MKNRYCNHCGKRFRVEGGKAGRPKMYCSAECVEMAALARKPAVPARPCGWCLVEFTPSGPGAMTRKYCSDGCREHDRLRKSAAYSKKHRDKVRGVTS